jgi:non-ribosomal peptide synthetase component E (peptide arylation enzyme)
MFLTPPDRVADHVARGWWDGTTVDALFQRTARAGGDAIALIDPPNRVSLDGATPERRMTSSRSNCRTPSMR